MLTTSSLYLTYLRELGSALHAAGLASSQLGPLQKSITSTELLIPVVGSFSAGKSTLLNKFLERDILPVAILPETELATELRHDTDERIEAIDSTGKMHRYALSAMQEVKQAAHAYSHLRIYLNSTPLQEIEPLVLVDMPGFGSAAINHNKAIGNYLSRGAHFISVTSAEEGGMTRASQVQLQDIVEMERHISFVLAKVNLKPDSEIRDIAALLADQAEALTGARTEVALMGNSAAPMTQVLAAIDPEHIVKTLFKHQLTSLHFGLLENTNITLASLQRSASDNQRAVTEMAEAIAKIARKRDQLLEDMQDRYANVGIQSTVDAVGRALTDAGDDMVALLQGGDKEGLTRMISDIVRSALLKKLKAQITDITTDVVREFALEIAGLDKVMAIYSSDTAWSTVMADKLLADLAKIQTNIIAISKSLDKDGSAAKVFRAVATVLAVATNVVAPIVELIIIFLPNLLPTLLGGVIRDKVRNAVMTELIPSVKEQLRRELPAIFAQQLQSIVEQVSGEFERRLLEKQEAVALHQSATRPAAEAIAQRESALQLLQQQMSTLANRTIFAQEQP